MYQQTTLLGRAGASRPGISRHFRQVAGIERGLYRFVLHTALAGRFQPRAFAWSNQGDLDFAAATRTLGEWLDDSESGPQRPGRFPRTRPFPE